MYKNNALERVRLSTSHFMGTVVINGTLVHAMIDTCGAKSMIDKRTAMELGFEVEVATRDHHFGSFYGPGDKIIYYYGRVKGPLHVHIDEDIYLMAPEIKVIEHTVPLLLIGTDVLTDAITGDWKFAYVGLHPFTRKGNLVIVHKSGTLKDIPLTSWPDKHNRDKPPMKIKEILPKAQAKK